MTNTTKKIGYTTIAAKIGSYVELDNRRGELLGEGHPPVLPGFAGCQFSFKCPLGRPIACNVEITGRTLQRRQGADAIRVRIEWVGDCEPSTFTRGWLFL